MIFLKLGGSLITDKTGVEAVREDVLARVAAEIAAARRENPGLRLVVGHGGGSFGHVAAAQYGTRQGVETAEQWLGFAEVHAAMVRLNRLVTEAMLLAGIPALSLQPSASALCKNGRIVAIAAQPVLAALDAGLVPVIYGDVAFDAEIGGTIISTEEVMMALADALNPSWLLLAGEVPGVLDEAGCVIPMITADNFVDIQSALGGSRGTDVTGGMTSKVKSMLALVAQQPALSIRILSGLEAGLIGAALGMPESAGGTRISQ
ncbi:MAG: isopentenyl phosphate kinase family protein [Anaerolineae bacterium]|nr:isopentenyl phosphate kinase family protein [Anaerolineae bacterium]